MIKMKKNTIWLIVGIVLFIMGSYQNTQYEEHSLTVSATITSVKTVDDTDDGPISYKHTYYGDYTVDGKQYTNKKLESKYNSSHIPDLHKGDTIEIRVYPDNPSKKVPEGGWFITVGFIMVVYNIIKIRKLKRMDQE